MPNPKTRQVIPDTLDGEAIARIELTRGQWAIVYVDDWEHVRYRFMRFMEARMACRLR